MKLKSVLLLSALLSVPGTLLASEAHSRAYGPQTIVRVAKPTLRWEVWPGKGSRLTSSKMTINGKSVHATYDDRNRVLAYTPSEPMAAGTYRVSCKVMVDDFLPVTKDWDFRIASGAVVNLPAPTDEQVGYVEEINDIRAALSLPALMIDARLCAAADAHTKYLAINGMTGHYENASDPGFVGNSPGDRLDAFGFAQGSWEGVDFGPHAPGQSIRRLFDAPYHRIPFLQPGTTLVGAGFAPAHMTLEFGMSDATGTVVSPSDGQSNIPLSWRGPEMPDPLAIHGVGGVCGYPVVFSHFSPTFDKIVVERASLKTENGSDVPFWLNSPKNDSNLEFAAFIIPKRSLTPNSAYVVSVKAHTKSGKDISGTWQFTTGAR